MQIIIHRGTHQIGGCATEIRTKNTRILIDFGAELPDENGVTTEDTLQIPGLNVGDPAFHGVFLTHYHGDHLGLIHEIPDTIPIWMGETALEIFGLFSARVSTKTGNSAKCINPLRALQPVFVGDMKVTPIPADHSAYDSLMFVIEADGKRILHTGDFRLHGFRSKATRKLLDRYASNIDAMIVEGTRASGGTHSGMSEFELQAELRELVKKHKYIFALCASTNIDRLAAFYNATPRGRYFVCDNYQKEILEVVAASTESKWYQFEKMLTYGKNLKLNKYGFVMPVRANRTFKNLAEQFPDAILVYSMWGGYLDGRSPGLTEFVKPFRDSGRMCSLHSSGHASMADIETICNAVAPRLGVIPIHTATPDAFTQLNLSCPTICLKDREVFLL